MEGVLPFQLFEKRKLHLGMLQKVWESTRLCCPGCAARRQSFEALADGFEAAASHKHALQLAGRKALMIDKRRAASAQHLV